MRAEHRSRLAIFRQPYGAVPGGTKVRFRIHIQTAAETVKKVRLCYSYGLYDFFTNQAIMLEIAAPKAAASSCGESVSQGGERRTAADNAWYEISLTMPTEPALFFYYFEIECRRDKKWVIPAPGFPSDTAVVDQEPAAYKENQAFKDCWQITVHEQDLKLPSWLPGSVFYQIFPDRFARDRDFDPEKMRDLCDLPERICHQDWSEPVDFRGKPQTGYIATDFYGGTLNGIREKLPYLQALGINVIYLNPIFKARSNHRYDTGDYEQIDPLLGTEQDLAELCSAADRLGIRLILDGVFSHTGADSRYFNLYDRYPEAGAVQAARDQVYSPWSSWFDLSLNGDQAVYESWWGFVELPNVKELDLGFREYIAGPGGILQKWLELGISGWRLDVSDELPDSFIRTIRGRLEQVNPEAVLLGEVWEDASCKHSYGSYRDFAFGRTHHQLMGYPFRKAVIAYLRGNLPAQELLQALETIREHYPLPLFYANLNLISSHDTCRAITALAGGDGSYSREQQSKMKLSPAERARGEKLLMLAYLIQTCYPGCSAIYYGDERSLEGYCDPFNRATFPWQEPEPELTSVFRQLGRLRQRTVLRSGYYLPLLAQQDVFVFGRYLLDGLDIFGEPGEQSAIICFINRGLKEQKLDLVQLSIEIADKMVLASDAEQQGAVLLWEMLEKSDAAGTSLTLPPLSGLICQDGDLSRII